MCKDIKMSKHHKRMKSHQGGNEPENILWCSQRKHRAFHLLFQNWEPPQIAKELNRWIANDWVVVAYKKR
jgi:hypothetical protein